MGQSNLIKQALSLAACAVLGFAVTAFSSKASEDTPMADAKPASEGASESAKAPVSAPSDSTKVTSPGKADPRFGLVGTGGAAFAAKFGLKYYILEGNYAEGKGTLFSSVDPAQDPAEGFSVVRKVAKLNVRTDALGESNAQFQAKLAQYAKDLAGWYVLPGWARGKKPSFTWYSPNVAALVAAESLQIVQTIRREKARNPAVTGTVWEIGNEPNLFPALTPQEYGALFAAYRRVIKGEDPGATAAMGSLFLPELCADLKAKLGEELESKMREQAQAAGMYALLNATGAFAAMVGDVKATLLSRMLAMPTREYLRQALAATGANPDIVTFHAYPYDDRAPFLDSAALKNIIDTTVAGMNAELAARGAAACPLWVTEFGNIEQGLSEVAVAARTTEFIGLFEGNPSIAMWFHYKATGQDNQLALVSSGAPPLTRLAADADFAPADGNFSCSKLNAVGRAYFAAAHGGAACKDPNAAPVIDSLRVDRAVLAEGGTANLRAFAADPDGDSLVFLWKRANGDTLGVRAELQYHASYRDAGDDTLILEVADAHGAKVSRAVALHVENTPLKPSILNNAGSALAPGEPLRWGWESDDDPDLDTATELASLEIYRDTLAKAPLLKMDSVKTKTITPSVPGSAGPVWARLRVHDGRGRESPWSDWRKLLWEGNAIVTQALEPSDLPKSFSLSAASSPLGRSLLILRLAMPAAASVRLQILDGEGLVRRSLFQGRLQAGYHAFPYDGRGERGKPLSGGIYFCRMETAQWAGTVPVVLIR